MFQFILLPEYNIILLNQNRNQMHKYYNPRNINHLLKCNYNLYTQFLNKDTLLCNKRKFHSINKGNFNDIIHFLMMIKLNYSLYYISYIIMVLLLNFMINNCIIDIYIMSMMSFNMELIN